MNANARRSVAAGVALSAALAVAAPMAGTRDTIAKARQELGARIDANSARIDVLEGKVPPTSVVPTTRPTPTSQPAPTVPRPPNPGGVCEIDPADGEAAISAAVAFCPNGTTVRFPANRSYTQANRILVADRVDLTIDGNGSTFTTTADGRTTQAINGNWVLLRGRNVTLKNMTAVGSFNIPGPRSLVATSAHPGYTEATMNYGVYGTDGAWLVDLKAHRAWGDAVTLGPDEYIDGSTPDFARNVHIIRMEARTSARHCWSPTSGTGVWIEDSTCTDAWYVGLDAETDTTRQPLKDHHYLRNTFDGFNLGGLLIPVPGPPGLVGDIEIRGNRFLGPPDVPCNNTVVVGAYPDAGPDFEIANVVIEDNQFRTYARAISVDHVNGGSIVNNRIESLTPPTGSTPEQFCGEGRQIIVTNSKGVRQ